MLVSSSRSRRPCAAGASWRGAGASSGSRGSWRRQKHAEEVLYPPSTHLNEEMSCLKSWLLAVLSAAAITYGSQRQLNCRPLVPRRARSRSPGQYRAGGKLIETQRRFHQKGGCWCAASDGVWFLVSIAAPRLSLLRSDETPCFRRKSMASERRALRSSRARTSQASMIS